MFNWIKQNKIVSLLVLVILFLILNQNSGSKGIPTPYKSSGESAISVPSLSIAPVRNNFAPTPQQDRLVVTESNLSLVVKNVRQASDNVVGIAKEVGGFMVNQYLSQPNDAPYATVTVRVPQDKLQEVMNRYRDLSLKVTSENIMGTDVTDEYVDINSRLDTLNKTKAKFEDIMAKAVTVQDTLDVQRELINLQDQIDSLKGRQDYLKKTSELSKVTVYLSTDEFSLPYAPNETFRPEVIFKTAARSLIENLRNIAGFIIWVAVYSVIWVPALIIIYFVQKHRKTLKN